MATGDNILTGINKSEEWGILKAKKWIIASYDKDNEKIKWVEKISNGSENFVEEENKVNILDGEYEEDEKLLVFDSLHPSHNNRDMLDFLMKNKDEDIQVAMEGTWFQKLIYIKENDERIDEYSGEDVLTEVLRRGKVFARMSPKQKALLVEELQNHTGEMIGMCGDGANDCAALKSADVGLSLSEAEASIVAPFTSKVQDISSCVQLLILGRASLDLSYELFRYLIVYTYLQFVSVIILSTQTSTFDDPQYVFFDLGGVVPITILLSWTEANDKLINKRPVGSLFNKTVFLSIYGQVIIMISFVIGTYFNLREQNFYEESVKQSDPTKDGDETTTVFLITLPQYVFMGIAFHTATQFRKGIYTNIPIMVLLSFQFIMIGWVTLGPLEFMKDILNLSSLDFYFRVIIIGSGLANGFLTIWYEQILQRTIGKTEMEKPIEFKPVKRVQNHPKNQFLEERSSFKRKLD